jgi:hypothetical protein
LPSAPVDLFRHPLAASDWEQRPAATFRPSTRALWTSPLPEEVAAPPRRIIHARAVQSDEEMVLDRLGVRVAPGYHKCASGAERDRAVRGRVHTGTADGWTTILDFTTDDEDSWFPLEGLTATSVLVEIREAAVDRWWPGWNLVMGGLELQGRPPARWRPSSDRYLAVDGVDLAGLPAGVEATERNGEVRFRTRFLEVGFRLRSAGFAFLGLDADGGGATDRNLLQLPRSMDIVRSGVYPSGVYPVLRDQHAEYLAQGPRLTTVDGRRAAGFLALEQRGSTTVQGSTVRYRLRNEGFGHALDLTWRVHEDHLALEVRRTVSAPLRAWHSGVWHTATNNRVTPSTLLGGLTQVGETGGVTAPALWHFPRHGSLEVSVERGAVSLRADSVRPLDTNTCEIKVGEEPGVLGDHLIRAGTHEATLRFAVVRPDPPALRDDTPAPVRGALERHWVTSLAFRPDTATYSNNGASMHCTSLLNDLSSLSLRLPPPVHGADPAELLRLSLERWLDGAPGYGSGRTSHGQHLLEDEYVQIAADTLVALARYLEHRDDGSWLASRERPICDAVEAMRRRDVDGDGLVESTFRRGVTGEHQWSTAWADVLSFGWKDAWANAITYEAVRGLERAFVRLQRPDLLPLVDGWADRLQETYLAAFRNPETGWIAGWRSRDDELHDYAFPLVNGAACRTDLLDVGTARAVMQRLWDEFARVGYGDFRNGVPLNLRRVPEADIGGVVFGLPMGGYQQGGASHHRTRLFTDALFRVGMQEEGALVLESLSCTVADDSAFGGLGSGVDWRMWDGTPSGYEGQLAEGFSFFSTALDRYAARPR